MLVDVLCKILAGVVSNFEYCELGVAFKFEVILWKVEQNNWSLQD